MFGIGGFELFLILLFGFLIFGPEKLPDLAKTVGKGISRFREAQKEVNETIESEKIFDPDNPDEPFKDPTVIIDRLVEKHDLRKEKEKEEAASASGEKSDEDATGDKDAQDETGDKDEESQESFTERKERHERQNASQDSQSSVGQGRLAQDKEIKTVAAKAQEAKKKESSASAQDKAEEKKAPLSTGATKKTAASKKSGATKKSSSTKKSSASTKTSAEASATQGDES